MKRFLPLVILVSVLACAGGKIVLQVDVLSFLAPQDRTLDYAAPLAPIPISVQGLAWGPDTEVRLAEALADLTRIESARMIVAVEARNRKGRGRAQLILRLAEEAAGLGNAAAVVDTLEITVAPDSTSTSREIFDLSEDLLTLFEARSFFLRVEVDLFAGAGAPGDSLAGVLEFTELSARVTADEEFFAAP